MGTTRKLPRRTPVPSPWAMEKPKREALRTEKREAILRAASRCFAEKGVELTTMDDVAATLGVTKPTVYRLFRDKAALVQACEEKSAARFSELLAETRARGGTAVEQLRHYFIRDLRLMQDDDFGRLLVLTSGQDFYSGASRVARTMREENQKGIRAILAEGIARGEFDRSLDPRMVALALFATFNFVQRWYDPRGKYSLDEIGEQYFAMFLNGIRARP